MLSCCMTLFLAKLMFIAEVGSTGRGNSLGCLGKRIVFFCEDWAKLKRTKEPHKKQGLKQVNSNVGLNCEIE